MIKIIKPYGYIRKDLVASHWTWNKRFFIRDIIGNIFETNEETYKELEHDRN